MKKNFILTFLTFLLVTSTAFAHINVIYPKSSSTTINAGSTFIIGNTKKGANFTINSQNVKLWDNNFFVQVIPLSYGKNTIRMVSSKNGIKEEKIYTILRPRQNENKYFSKEEFQPKKAGYNLYTKTTKNNAAIRELPSDKRGRVTDLPAGIVLYLAGRQGDYYKIEEAGDTQYWIHKSNVQTPKSVKERTTATITNASAQEDEQYKYIKFSLNYPVMYKLTQKDNNIELTLFGIRSQDKNGAINNNYTYTYSQPNSILGYDAYYQGNTLVMRIAKAPTVKDIKKPLSGMTIFVDAGHGGSEKGSIGPTGICEKDINLAISKYLVKYLKSEGANVVVSRNTDKQVDLYDRVKIAKDNKAFISLSIHNNALPDGKDPYKTHGTEVHYYNENAKALAEYIQKEIVQNLYFKDNGIHKSSFALNRETNPISVLVECAYMINPEEYSRIKNTIVQKQIAKSIKNGIKKFIIDLQE